MTLDMGRPVAISGYRIDHAGRLSLLTDWGPVPPESAEVEVTYARDRKPKVLGRAPLDPSALWSHPNAALLQFDRIFAVDTNTRTIRGVAVSATAVVLAQPIVVLGSSLLKWAVCQAIEHRHVDCPPERLGWKRFLELATATKAFSSLRRVALVVDSDLGNLRLLNDRTQALLDHFYLPGNATMLYASSDAGAEYIGNRLIRDADRAATALLNQLEKCGDRHPETQPFAGDHSTYFRLWAHE